MNSQQLFQNHRKNVGEFHFLQKRLTDLDNQTDTPHTREQKEILRFKIKQCETENWLFETILLTMTDTEKWIIQTHFVAGYTMVETLDQLPNNMLFSSRSSLTRRINTLLKKADLFLSSHLANDEKKEGFDATKQGNDIGSYYRE